MQSRLRIVNIFEPTQERSIQEKPDVAVRESNGLLLSEQLSERIGAIEISCKILRGAHVLLISQSECLRALSSCRFHGHCLIWYCSDG